MSADSRLMALSLRAWGDPDIQWAVEEIKRLNYEIGQLTLKIADAHATLVLVMHPPK